MYCRNCGNELSATAKFCQECGTRTTDIDVAGLIKEKAQSFSPGKEKAEQFIKTGDNRFYIGAAITVVLNFIFHFVGILKYDAFFTEGNISLFKLLGELSEYDDDVTLSVLNILAWTGPVLIAATAGLYAYKLFAKKYNDKRNLLFVTVAVIYSNLVQMAIIIMIRSELSDEFFDEIATVSFAGYLLFILAAAAVFMLIKSYSSPTKKTVEADPFEQELVSYSYNG